MKWTPPGGTDLVWVNARAVAFLAPHRPAGQGRSQGGTMGANAPERFSGAPEELLLAYVESPT